MKMNMNIAAVSAFCALTSLASPGWSAEPPAMRVKLGDLDLQTTTGAHVALKRIQLATSQYCWERNAPQMGRHVQMRACRKDMLNRSIEKLAAPRVTALYLAPKTQQPTLLAKR